MKIAQFPFGLSCLAIPASNIATMSRWRDARMPSPQAAPLGRGPAGLGAPSR